MFMKKLKIFLIVCLIICLIPLIINFTVILTSKNSIYNIKDIDKKYDVALVLGCSVIDKKTPSKMLKDRLDMAINLYNEKKVEKILVSGDERKDYSEVAVMKYYLEENNINSEDIEVDNIGYSTGESIKNFYENNSDQTAIIVTQEYHLYRALYIAKRFKIDAVGVYAEKKHYPGDLYREGREILARNKDFILYLNKR